jgi:hypothetical protein
MAQLKRPLTYLVHPLLLDTPEVQALIRKGHTVTAEKTLDGPDLVIGPNCYRISPETINLLDMATLSARLSKYGPPPRRGTK